MMKKGESCVMNEDGASRKRNELLKQLNSIVKGEILTSHLP